MHVCLLRWRERVPPLHLGSPSVQPVRVPLAGQLHHRAGPVHPGWGFCLLLLGPEEAKRHPCLPALLLFQQSHSVGSSHSPLLNTSQLGCCFFSGVNEDQLRTCRSRMWQLRQLTFLNASAPAPFWECEFFFPLLCHIPVTTQAPLLLVPWSSPWCRWSELFWSTWIANWKVSCNISKIPAWPVWSNERTVSYWKLMIDLISPGPQNACTRFLLCCLKCCFWCLEHFIKFVNRNAYIMVSEETAWTSAVMWLSVSSFRVSCTLFSHPTNR